MLTQIDAEPLLFLKTYDRYSGELHMQPMFYRKYGSSFVIATINESEFFKPEWYLNIKEEPIVEIEIAGQVRFAMASTPVGEDRMDIWPLVEALSEDYKKHLPGNVTGVLLTPME